MLHEIKKEYSKLLEDVFYNNKKPIDNTIIDLFTEIIDNKIENIEVDDIESLFNKLDNIDNIDNNKIVVYRSNETPEAEVIINSENVESDDEYIDIEYLSKYNKVNRAITVNASKKFYVYFSDDDILYETMCRIQENDYGPVYYDVLIHKGELIDTIEEDGDYYNIVKFKETGEIERVPERKLLRNHFNAFNEEVTPHIMKDFDFTKPLIIEVDYDIEENEDEDEE